MSVATRTVAWANLDFELELAARDRRRPLPSPVARWSAILRLLPQARQAHCWEPATSLADVVPVGAAEQLVVWGVSRSAIELAERLQLRDRFPSVEAVRTANDKRFSHQLEREFGIALPHSRVVSSLAQLRESVDNCPHAWVLKHPFGFSGLERTVGKAGQLSDSSLGWARRRLADGWSLLFEPWVEESQNLSMHFVIDGHGLVSFLGHCQLLTDLGGVHRGNRVTGEPLDPFLHKQGAGVCRELARLGYWGYVGIDALSGHLAGAPVVRPLVEINARCSFGRLTLALADWIPDGWSYLWWHPPRNAPLSQPVRPLPSPGIQQRIEAGAYALPELADPQQQSGTVVLIAPTSEELCALMPRT